jgi:predicted Zn finger-like uncharacterized protein
MILACPACSTRFSVDVSALGPGGRRVRCGSCRHVWHQPAPQAEIEPAEEPLPALFADAAKEEARAAPRVTAVADVEEPLPPPIASPAVRPTATPRRSGASGFAWALLALIVIVVAGGAVIAKDQVLATFPQTERFYAMVGLTQPQVGTGLELRKVSWKRERADGVSVLLIEGEVANVSKEVRPVPKIRGAILGSGDRELSFWLFAPPEPRLLPGESVRFRTELRNPPEGAERLTMNFAYGS